jgi:hypothetical protein
MGTKRPDTLHSTVLLLEDADLAVWSLVGAALGAVVGLFLLRVFSIVN